ncbi:MAG TPA: VanZ family protein [Candidatus Paceibacterota bacterium]|nr:VanZ family protein [Candidatus Paceibacterota bacterium]
MLDYTLFQFQSLIVLKYFLPGLMLNGQPDGKSVNLLPLVALGPADVTTSLLNILLFVPFGFGLPFVSRFGFGWTVAAGVLVSAAIETAQFATGYAAGITFRIADVNDVLFNTAGAAIGYLLFLAFARFYRRFARAWGMGADPISRHIIERPQLR